MSFKEVNPKQNFPDLEKNILDFWEKNKIFQKSLDKNKDKEKFIFYEGPPTANGKPGIHHVLARSYKDIICRYQTMKGKYVGRRAGWDTHGLPVEIAVEKELGISGKKQIEDYGVEKFNKKCKESVWTYKEDWEKLTKRIGFWIDLKNPYITYENSYIEKVWGILKEIYQKDLLYKGFKVVPYCPRCGTPLSSHEVAQGYKKITEPSVYLKFKLKNEKNSYILSWTTTPWTLPGNVALAVGKDIEYSKIKVGDENWILATARLGIVNEKYDELENVKGSDLVGLEYEPLFEIDELQTANSHQVYYADFVTTEDGTGVVHTAVMYGEDDYQLGEEKDLPKFHTVEATGHFNKIVPVVGGDYMKDKTTEEKIIDYLKSRGAFLKIENYEHDYPFCWRCDSPLIYYAKNSWFIAMSKLREELIKNNETINWIPDYIKTGRFGEWLSEVKDWALSRERYWGTPLPVWQCQTGKIQNSKLKIQNECQNIKIIGSVQELETLATVPIDEKKLDLHRPFVDEIKLKCEKCGGEMERVKDLIDVWFDSGSMPFASGEEEAGNYPAEYISEALDQTRGWFYTLLAISTLLEKDASYKNVICLGLVLDENGKKMSKSRGNIIDPFSVIDKYGSDSLRWFFYTVNSPGDAKRMGEKDIAETLRKFILILWNVYSFFVTYANIDSWEYKGGHYEPKELLDKWITNFFYQTVKNTKNKLDQYDVTAAAREIEKFNTDLSTWYLRRSRKRRDNDFYATMFKILIHFSKVIAPFVPFVAEEIYQGLRSKTDNYPESVHLCDWPEVGDIDQKLLENMQKVRDLAEQGRALRAEAGIRNRQPLAKFTINIELARDYQDILADELNVLKIEVGKELELDTNITPELKNEGIYRDILRSIQALRKEASLNPKANVQLFYDGDSDLKVIFSKREKDIERATNVTLEDKKDPSIKFQSDYTIDSKDFWIGIK